MSALLVEPGTRLSGATRVPGDKSIAHRWLILATTASGSSHLAGVPRSLDVRSTAACLAQVSPSARAALEGWSTNDPAEPDGHGSTWNRGNAEPPERSLEVEGSGHACLTAPDRELDCGNSATSMRLLAGVVAGVAARSILTGDESLRGRPMERAAVPLRAMGAGVDTTGGCAPITIRGGGLRGIRYRVPIASAQVKGCVLLAGLSAEGETVVEEPAPTRDHTERALVALGGPVVIAPGRVSLRPFQHVGFTGTVPGDLSSAAFLVAAAALTGSALTITRVGLNPSRTRLLEVMGRMGVRTTQHVHHEELGEPVGDLEVEACAGLIGTRIEAAELPLVIDEVPILALVAAHATGETWFLGAAELRVKESDRIAALVAGVRALGGRAQDEGPDLVIGGGGLHGGHASGGGDHRMAMALAIAALAARGPSRIDGIEAAEVSFPGFVPTLHGLGARIEEG
ncbi:MAG: 3-phosphoshikimate 1-carboxyvinyltransferase [Actinomycetota bacterium]